MCNSSTKNQRLALVALWTEHGGNIPAIAKAWDKTEITVRRVLRDCRECGLIS